MFDAQCLVKTGIEMMKGSFNVRFLFSERRAWIVSHFEDLWILDHDESTNQETTKMELPDVHLCMFKLLSQVAMSLHEAKHS